MQVLALEYMECQLEISNLRQMCQENRAFLLDDTHQRATFAKEKSCQVNQV